jgi:tetratricopeptide (TPR) repeat protein
MITFEPTGAKKAFRRAVALDPARTRAWDGLVGTAADEENPDDLVSVSEQRLKYDDTALNRAVAAKACDRADLHEAALRHARTAVHLDPKEPAAQLALGTLMLRRPADEEGEKEMMQHFASALELIEKMDESERRSQLYATWSMNLAVVMALSGKPEKAREALRWAAKAAADEKDKKLIREIETAIN